MPINQKIAIIYKMVGIIKSKLQKFLSSKWHKYLLLLIFFHTIFFVSFRILNKNYQTWDSAGHIGLSYRIANEIKRYSSGVEGASVSSIMKVSNYYPPFVQLIGAVISLAFGYKSIFLLIETFLFFVLSIIFTYKLAYLLTKDQKKSFLTAAIYSLFPQIIDQSHYFHLDIPLTALVLMAIYFLLISDRFKKIFPTITFFVLFSFIQLTKWTGFVFILTPLLIVMFQAFQEVRKSKDSRKIYRVLGNFFVGSVLFFILVLPWYYVNWRELIAQVKVFSVGESDDPTNLWQSLLYYPLNAVSHQIMFLPFVLTFISMIRIIRRDRKKGLVILFNILVPWLVFVLISNKNLRYTLPLMPLVAYLNADILLAFPKNIKIGAKLASIFTLVYLALASSFLSFFSLQKESPILMPISIFFTGFRYKAWYYYGTSFYSYKSYRYPVDKILKYIYEDANEAVQAIGVANLVDSEGMSAATVELVRIEEGYNNIYLPVPYFQFEPFKSDEDIKAFFYETGVGYVITSTDPGPEGLRNYSALKQATEYLEKNDDMFVEVRDFSIDKSKKKLSFKLSPDETITVYKKRSSSTLTEVPVDGCKFGAGMDDGIETINLSPNHTYVFYTGHFAIQDKIWRDYKKGVLYVVQIENTVHESLLDVHNLPKSGSSFCSMEGLNKDFSGDIKKILTEDNQCGEGTRCNEVVYVKWSVGDPDVEVTGYTLDSIE